MVKLRDYGDSNGNILLMGGVQKAPPFDIKEIQVTNKNYKAAQWIAYVEPEDEIEVLDWINDEEKANVVDLTEQLEKSQGNLNHYIEESIRGTAELQNINS